MIRLVLCDLRHEWRLWLSAIVALTAAAVVACLDSALFATAASLTGDPGRDLSSIAGSIATFNGVTAAVVVSSVTTLCVSLQRRQHALWQLAGARPGQVALIVLGQVLILALLTGVLGALVTVPLVGPVFDLLAPTVTSIAGASVAPVYPAQAALWAIAILVVVAIMGALRGATRAARVRAIEALREQEGRTRRMGWGRWTVTVAAALLTVPGLVVAAVAPLNTGAAALPTVGPLLVAIVSALSPLLLPPLMGAWTRVVPRRASVAWQLARANAMHKLSVTTSVVTPILTAAALVGGLFTAFTVLSHAIYVSTGRIVTSDADVRSMLILLGGPVLLAGLGAALTIVMSGRDRDRDLALLRVAGGTRALALRAAALEAVIYAITAALTATLVVGLEAVLMAALLSIRTPGTTPGLDLTAMLVICGVGLVLLLGATLIPGAVAARRPPVLALADE